MAKYEIKASTYVKIHGEDVYFKADPQDPQVIEIPDDVEPSSKWIPLDEGARAAKKRLNEFRALPKDKKEAELQKRADEKEAEEVRQAESRFKVSQKSSGGGGGGTQHHGGTELSNPVPAGAHEKGKRPADKSPL